MSVYIKELKFFNKIIQLHGLSCALKALCTSETANFVDVLRRSCGGHGFMQASNFPRLFAMVTASETYEVSLFYIV